MLFRNLFFLCLAVALSVLGLRAESSRPFVVVLDAGHGGHDPGAVGNGGREKKITLSVVRKLGSMIQRAHPEVMVLYTRTTDTFVGLQARADFANRNKANLFISVHVNSAKSEVSGTETYVLGLAKQGSNFSAAIRENKAMLLEKDYKRIYRGFDPTSTESYIMFDLMQDAYLSRSIDLANLIEREYKRLGRKSRGVRQDIFWVLSQSAMPSVLTEIGFISDKREARFLVSEAGQEQIARALSKAFTSFYSGSTEASGLAIASEPTSSKPRQEVEETQSKISRSKADRTTSDRQEAEAQRIVRNAKQAKAQSAQPGGKSLREMRAEDNALRAAEVKAALAQRQEPKQDLKHKPKASAGAQTQATTVQREARATVQSQPSSVYRIQIFALSRRLTAESPELSSLDMPITITQEGGLYYYTVGQMSTLGEARKLQQRIRKHYKDAFIVRYEGERRVEKIF